MKHAKDTAFWADNGPSRRKMMGHGSLKMTQHYTDTFVQQRNAADAIAENLFPESGIVQ